ncbi:hypothetical protein [Massilia niabensis]|uniref:Uncharacterized protein n=1 Tax=Massilia niabensis TaxID=544910 RepID=A0ABW0L4W5_9BURK
MRSLSFALLVSAVLVANPGAYAAPGPTRHVNLDMPGALERVRQDNPAHFAAITQILREAPVQRPQALAGWVRTAFDAKMASAMLIKTSYPPQARLEFTLDDTGYRAMVTLRNTEPSISPATRQR